MFPLRPLSTISDALARGRDSIMALRLILAGAVLVSHAFLIVHGHRYVEPLVRWTGFDLGQHAVNLFFVLSGFLVVQSLERRDLVSYLAARLLRVLPGLVCAAIAVVVLIGPLQTTQKLFDYFGNPATLTGLSHILTFDGKTELPGVFTASPAHEVMATVWTLKYELACYLGLALVGLCHPRWRVLFVLCLLALAMVLLAEARELQFPGPVESSARFAMCFLIGVAAWLCRKRLPLDIRVLPLLAGVVVLFVNTPFERPLMIVFEAYAVLWLAFVPLLADNLAAPAADLSYGIYLYGFPLEQVAWAVAPSDPWALLVLALPLTLLIAALSWRFVERPALAYKAPVRRKALILTIS
jgi:peptidoglycan/LPS O-acetylase OafA/YrhL